MRLPAPVSHNPSSRGSGNPETPSSTLRWASFPSATVLAVSAKCSLTLIQERKFLGYTFWLSSKNEFRCMIASKTLKTMKARVRQMTSRMRGRSLAQICLDLRAYLPGWKAYFRLVELESVFRELDSWIRHRLRALQLKHWDHGPTIFRELQARGMSAGDARRVAGNASRYWHNSKMLINFALPNKLFDELGLPRLAT